MNINIVNIENNTIPIIFIVVNTGNAKVELLIKFGFCGQPPELGAVFVVQYMINI